MHECPGFLSIKHSSTHPKGSLCVGTNDSIQIHCCEYIYRLYQSMVSIYIRITEKSLSNFDSNPIGYQIKRQVRGQRFEIREKSANIEKTDIRHSAVRGRTSACFPIS